MLVLAFFPTYINPIESGDYSIKGNENLAIAWIEQRKINCQSYHSCHSAFNGIGIYKWEIIKDFKYSAYQTPELKELQASLCEHVPFNYEIVQRGYKLYIARDMKTIMRYDRALAHHRLSKWKNYFPSFDFLKNHKAVRQLVLKHYFPFFY